MLDKIQSDLRHWRFSLQLSFLVKINTPRHPGNRSIIGPCSPSAVGGEGPGPVEEGGEHRGDGWGQGGAVHEAGAANHGNTMHQGLSPERRAS